MHAVKKTSGDTNDNEDNYISVKFDRRTNKTEQYLQLVRSYSDNEICCYTSGTNITPQPSKVRLLKSAKSEEINPPGAPTEPKCFGQFLEDKTPPPTSVDTMEALPQ